MLMPYVCENCGFWQRYFTIPPSCPVCIDVRNDLPEDGWSFRRADAVAQHTTTTWREIVPGVFEYAAEPAVGLGGCGWLLRTASGNIAYEATGWYSEDALAHIASLGGIAWLSTSHPHGTGALWQLQDRFAPAVPLHVEGLPWSKAFRVTDPYDDTFALDAARTLHHIGGHYEGHAILHDRERELLFCGDMLKVELNEAGDACAISTHKAYHKRIPLTPAEVRRYRDTIAALAFRRVFTPFESGAVTNREAVALFDTLLRTRPSVAPISLAALHESFSTIR